MRASCLAVSVMVLICTVVGCNTGGVIKSSEQARRQSQIFKTRSIGEERSLEVLDIQLKAMDDRIGENERQMEFTEKQLAELNPKIKEFKKLLRKASPVEKGYLEPEYNELEGRKTLLKGRIEQADKERRYLVAARKSLSRDRWAKQYKAMKMRKKSEELAHLADDLAKEEAKTKAKSTEAALK